MADFKETQTQPSDETSLSYLRLNVGSPSEISQILLVGVGDLGFATLQHYSETYNARLDNVIVIDNNLSTSKVPQELDFDKLIEGVDFLIFAVNLANPEDQKLALSLAKITQEKNILTLGIVSENLFEDQEREDHLHTNLKDFVAQIDSYILLDSKKLLPNLHQSLSKNKILGALADLAAQSIWILTLPMLFFWGSEFVKLREMLKNSGRVVTALGFAKGENFFEELSKQILNAPLLEGEDLHKVKHAALAGISSPHFMINDFVQSCETLVELTDYSFYTKFEELVIDDKMEDDELYLALIVSGLEP